MARRRLLQRPRNDLTRWTCSVLYAILRCRHRLHRGASSGARAQGRPPLHLGGNRRATVQNQKPRPCGGQRRARSVAPGESGGGGLGSPEGRDSRFGHRGNEGLGARCRRVIYPFAHLEPTLLRNVPDGRCSRGDGEDELAHPRARVGFSGTQGGTIEVHPRGSRPLRPPAKPGYGQGGTPGRTQAGASPDGLCKRRPRRCISCSLRAEVDEAWGGRRRA